MPLPFPSLCVPVFPCMLPSINTMNVDDTFYGPCHTQSNSTALPPRNTLPSSLALGWASHHLPRVQDQINSQIECSYWWRVGIWTQSGYTRVSVQSSKNGKMKQHWCGGFIWETEGTSKSWNLIRWEWPCGPLRFYTRAKVYVWETESGANCGTIVRRNEGLSILIEEIFHPI